MPVFLNIYDRRLLQPYTYFVWLLWASEFLIPNSIFLDALPFILGVFQKYASFPATPRLLIKEGDCQQ